MEKSAPAKIRLDIDADGSFDYSTGRGTTFSLSEYKQIFFNEVNSVHE